MESIRRSFFFIAHLLVVTRPEIFWNERNNLKGDFSITQIPHGTGIFTYIWLRFMVNVGKYSSPMEHLGKGNPRYRDFFKKKSCIYIYCFFSSI